MTNFEKPIQEMSGEELLNTVNRFTMESAQVAMGELTRRSTKDLKESIDGLNKSTGLYSKAISTLTLFLIIIAIEQLLITIFPAKGIWIWIYILLGAALLGMALWLWSKTLDIK